MTDNEKIEALLASQGSRFVNIRTITTTGAIIEIVTNQRELPALLAKQQAVSIAAAKAAQTRAARYPTLKSVQDRSPRKVNKYGAPGVSGFYLDSVLAVKANGVWHDFRQPRQPYYVAAPLAP